MRSSQQAVLTTLTKLITFYVSHLFSVAHWMWVQQRLPVKWKLLRLLLLLNWLKLSKVMWLLPLMVLVICHLAQSIWFLNHLIRVWLPSSLLLLLRLRWIQGWLLAQLKTLLPIKISCSNSFITQVLWWSHCSQWLKRYRCLRSELCSVKVRMSAYYEQFKC